jgi:DNA-binding CsgD family transcriptional regulator/tetratricopeptide (TPR) repeat protein
MPDGDPAAFVGRLGPLAELEAIWAGVLEHRRRAVFIGGEPGVGKTRLAAEAAHALHEAGAAVLWGACYPDLDVPYRPFVTALEQLLRDGEPGDLAPLLGDSAARLLRLTPLVGRHRPDLAAVAPDPHDPRIELFDAVRDLLLALTARQPVVLVLEDLHWAAAPTLQLLTHVVQGTARARLLILVTHRTTEPDRTDELTYTIADLYRHDGVSRIDLAGLATEEIAEYLRREAGLAGRAALRSATVLRDQTGGNPFFLHELWRDLRGRGGIETLRAPSFRAPRSVRDTLERRLAALPSEQLEVIELAAVVGEVVDLSVLVAASRHSPDVTLAAVDGAVGFGVLAPDTVAPGRYRFLHTLVRQAVLDRLPPSRRTREHARVAEALEGRAVDDPWVVAQLAHHYERAHVLGYADQAVTYLVAAAEHAERSVAHEEAAELYGRAAALRASVGPPRHELLFAAARSHTVAGHFAAARRRYEELARSDDPVVALWAAVGHEDASWRPGLHGARSVQLLEAALQRCPDDDRDATVLRARASLGRALSFTGDRDRAEEVGEGALRAARELGDDEVLAHALSATLWRGMVPTLAPVLLARAVELSGLGRRLGADDHLGPAGFYRGVFGYMLGQPDDWAAAHDDQIRAARHGQRFFRYVTGCGEYARRFSAGDLEAAAHTVAALDELGSEFGPDTTEGSFGIQTFMIRRVTGQLEAVRPLLSGAEDPAGHWAPGLLALYTELGFREPAERVLAHLRDRLPAQRANRAQWAGVLAFLVDAVEWLGDRAAAADLRPLAGEYAGLNLIAGQFVAVFGSADRYLGVLDSLLGAPTADAHFEQALAMDRRMGAVTHQVETLTAWSRHGLRVGSHRDLERVGRLRAEARVLAERVGHRRALRELVDAAAASDGRGTLPDGLTAREVDVLRLVAAGLSNREIGQRLYISQNTAANHVRSILMKTGASNRTGAAIYAAEHRLLGDGVG